MEQQEYGIAWALVGLILVLALLVVCFPRPRAADLTPVDKMAIRAAKRKKKGDRIKKKNLKQKQKQIKR